MTSRVIVLTLVVLGCSLSLTAQRYGMDPQQPASPFSKSAAHENSAIAGTVLDMNNKPLKDVRVELRDSGSVLNLVYTSASGSFEFSLIPAGNYLVVATAGTQQVSEHVEASGMSSMVNLRMPANNPGDGVKGNSISVVQYRIPAKARDEYRKAHESMEKDKVEDVKKHLAKALELYPNYADALTLRAVLELNENNAEAATADLDKAIHADPNYAMAYVVMGSALNLQSKFDEALRSLQRGESLEPNSWQAHFEMGKAYIGKSDYPAALHQLELAENMTSSEYPTIYLLRAHALLAMKQYPEALSAAQLFLEKDPHSPNSQLAHRMIEQAQAFTAKK
jgi:tetratricopeptide (TPR) repeat protein